MFITTKALPISFYRLYEDNYLSHTMEVFLCFEILYWRMPEFSVIEFTKKAILKKAKITTIDFKISEYNDYKWEDKLDLMLLFRFYKNSVLFVKDLTFKYEKLKIKIEDIENFIDPIQTSNKEFKLEKERVIEILSKFFNVNNYNVPLDEFFGLFNSNKLLFSIGVIDFLDISLFYLELIFSTLEKQISNFYDLADLKKQGVIFYKEFNSMMNVLVKSQNIWKVVDYYK